MDIEKEYSCLERNCKVYQKCIDVDEDYQEALPQYCDDIYRVVKCISRSYITSVDTNYNEVKLFGKIEISLTYFNESSCLCYADFEEEFTKLVDIDNITESAFASAVVNDKYTNFRVINQRRIDIHSSASVNVSVYDKMKCPCISSCNNSKLKVERLKTASVINTNISRAEFDEEFSVAGDSKAIKRIVSSSSFATLGETKIIKDKALIKAVVSLTVLYTTDEEEEQLSKCEYSFNISKIIDASGIDDSDIIIANISIGNIFFKAKSSSNDKLCVIEAFGDVLINSTFIRENEQELITDGYVLNHNSDCSYSDFACSKNGRLMNDTKMQSISFDLSAEVTEIRELNISLSESYARNGRLMSKATANAMCMTAAGSLTTFSSTADIEIEVENCQSAVSALTLQSYDYTMQANGKVDVRLSIGVSAYIYEEAHIKVLSEISADDNEINYPTLTVYFGKQNESIWSIAKSFSSDIDLIRAENDLSSEILDSNKILIIPGV